LPLPPPTQALIEALAECDEAIGEKFLMEEEPTEDEIRAAIRRATIATKFVPVFMGSAYKNKGVQKLLDGVIDYLPNPTEVRLGTRLHACHHLMTTPLAVLNLTQMAIQCHCSYQSQVVNMGIDNANEEKQVVLASTSEKPLIALAFKLEESRFGQLTYMRVYQGVLRKGDTIMNVTTGKKVKVPRVVRMHSNEMQDVNEGKAGDIIAMFGIDCHSGTTFTDGSQITLSPMRVPEPVISLAVKPKVHKDAPKFGKALARFVKEDPTFKVHADPESGETIISGMGELHLEIYCERIKREYDCEVVVGYPQVNYRETIGMKSDFNYLHKKQSGGAGQYGRVIGYIEPLNDDTGNKQYEFVNALTGNNIPPEFVNPISKGFDEAVGKGPNTGCKIENVRVVLVDGQSHPVDSNEIAFRLAAIGSFLFRPVMLCLILRVFDQAYSLLPTVVISYVFFRWFPPGIRKGEPADPRAVHDRAD
jgi:elongation factor G